VTLELRNAFHARMGMSADSTAQREKQSSWKANGQCCAMHASKWRIELSKTNHQTMMGQGELGTHAMPSDYRYRLRNTLGNRIRGCSELSRRDQLFSCWQKDDASHEQLPRAVDDASTVDGFEDGKL
jgi:hypothetical protein